MPPRFWVVALKFESIFARLSMDVWLSFFPGWILCWSMLWDGFSMDSWRIREKLVEKKWPQKQFVPNSGQEEKSKRRPKGKHYQKAVWKKVSSKRHSKTTRQNTIQINVYFGQSNIWLGGKTSTKQILLKKPLSWAMDHGWTLVFDYGPWTMDGP